MKKVLCISPHFPPVNAADMHRLRQSLPFFKSYGWTPIVFQVNPDAIEQAKDPLLLKSIPNDIEVHHVDAYSTRWTRKLGLGNLGIRAYLQFKRQVNDYLTHHKIDLIYFSTTVFSLMPLGVYWKKKFGIPFVIDLQDPWRNDYYLSIPKVDRPAKFWFDYPQKKWLEAYTMPHVDGIVAVSTGYIDTMKNRYPCLAKMPCITLPFSALKKDIDIARTLPQVIHKDNYIHITYIGRGGIDMAFSLESIFKAFSTGLKQSPDIFSKLRFHFIGTSYAANGKGIQNVMPIAERCEIADYVDEQTNRLPYFESLKALCDSDILIIPGSTDNNYTASKIFPYILTEMPILAVFNQHSSIVNILNDTHAGEVVTFTNHNTTEQIASKIYTQLSSMLNTLPYKPKTDWLAFEPFSAQEMTKTQCHYFDNIVTLHN